MSISCMSSELIPKALSISSMDNMLGLLAMGCSSPLPMSAAVLVLKLVTSSVALLQLVVVGLEK